MNSRDGSMDVSDELLPERRATGFLTFPRGYFLLFAGLDAVSYTLTLAAVVRWFLDVDLVAVSTVNLEEVGVARTVLLEAPAVEPAAAVAPLGIAVLTAGVLAPTAVRRYLAGRFPGDAEVPALSPLFFAAPLPLAVYMAATVSSGLGYVLLLFLATFFSVVIYDTVAPERYRRVATVAGRVL